MNNAVCHNIVFRYEELLDVSVPKPKLLQIHTSTSYIILGTNRVSVYALPVSLLRTCRLLLDREFSLIVCVKKQSKSLSNHDRNKNGYNARNMTLCCRTHRLQNSWIEALAHKRAVRKFGRDSALQRLWCLWCSS